MLSLFFAKLQCMSQIGPFWQLNRSLAAPQENTLEKPLQPRDSSVVITGLPGIDDVFIECLSIVIWMNA
jgi:hypothetical protein